jgi:hypothetical protein
MADYSRFLKRMAAAEAARGPEERRRVEKLRRAKRPPHRAQRIDTSKIARHLDRAAAPKRPLASDGSTLH